MYSSRAKELVHDLMRELSKGGDLDYLLTHVEVSLPDIVSAIEDLEETVTVCANEVFNGPTGVRGDPA